MPPRKKPAAKPEKTTVVKDIEVTKPTSVKPSIVPPQPSINDTRIASLEEKFLEISKNLEELSNRLEKFVNSKDNGSNISESENEDLENLKEEMKRYFQTVVNHKVKTHIPKF